MLSHYQNSLFMANALGVKNIETRNQAWDQLRENPIICILKSCLFPSIVHLKLIQILYNYYHTEKMVSLLYFLRNCCSISCALDLLTWYFLFFNQLGVAWEACGFTISDLWNTGPYAMRCQFVQISLIWGLLDCKLSWSASLSILNFRNFSISFFVFPFVQRFHIVSFYAFVCYYFNVYRLSLLLICYATLSHVLRYFVFHVTGIT